MAVQQPVPENEASVGSIQATAQDPVAPLVVVGAGLAGWTTVREFRKHDTSTPVVVVTADSGDFYAKPTLSNAMAQKRTPQQLVTTPAAKMAESLGVTLHAFARVLNISTASHALTLQTNSGSQTVVYGQLVLATGAEPIRAPMQGNAAERVRSVNALEDYARFYAELLESRDAPKGEALSGPPSVLIIGAGLIGCEFANDLLLGGYSVHVVDPSPRPLAAVLPEKTSHHLQDALQTMGAQWHFGTTAQAVNLGADGKLHVTLANGSVVQADAVLSAIGLRPNTALASSAGIACERGIVVNTLLQTSAPDVFALGDGAQYASAGNRPLPFVMPIMSAAKALAATLSGTPTELVFPLMPVSIKTPALPIVVSGPHPQTTGEWVEEGDAGVWRFVDTLGAQRGFVLSGKSTARRMELAKETVL